MKPIVTIEGVDIPLHVRSVLAGLSVEEQLRYIVLTKHFREFYSVPFVQLPSTQEVEMTRTEIMDPSEHEDVVNLLTCEDIVVGARVGICVNDRFISSEDVFFCTEKPRILSCGPIRYGGDPFSFVDIYAKYTFEYRV
jgi:hypothetical protein